MILNLNDIYENECQSELVEDHLATIDDLNYCFSLP